MARVMYLLSRFLLGCITSSLVAWVMSLHPALVNTGLALYLLAVVSWVFAWLADDSVIKFLKIDPLDYSAVLIGLAVAAALGGLVTWLTSNAITF
jgi:hypothetical protein